MSDKRCGKQVEFFVVTFDEDVQVRCKEHCFVEDVQSSTAMGVPNDPPPDDMPGCQYIDMNMSRRERIIEVLLVELDYQDAKYGKHRTQPPSEWLSVVMGELGETANELNGKEWKADTDFCDEMLQTAATSIQCLIQMNRDHSLMPRKRYYAQPNLHDQQAAGTGEQYEVSQ